MPVDSWRSNDLLRTWGQRVAGLILVVSTVGLVLVLKSLPYSTVRLAAVDPSEATRPPQPAFSVGLYHWPVRDLASGPALAPFREAMRASCGDAIGLAAAECASRVISERVPWGSPSHEFVNVDFDPLSHFKEHMAGAPGHCLTRSAILAAELLAVGIPARVVQFVPVEGKGHTLVEVWDVARGWTVVDPTTGGYLTGRASRGSAVELLAEPDKVDWQAFAYAAGTREPVEQKRYFRRLLAGNVLYPEPWLYLRLGERAAPWPFRGEYARVGPAFLTHGPLQQLLFWVIPALALAGSGLIATARRRTTAVRSPQSVMARPAGAPDAIAVRHEVEAD